MEITTTVYQIMLIDYCPVHGEHRDIAPHIHETLADAYAELIGCRIAILESDPDAVLYTDTEDGDPDGDITGFEYFAADRSGYVAILENGDVSGLIYNTGII